MKKYLAIILSICFVLSLTACNNKVEEISFSQNELILTVGETQSLNITTNVNLDKVTFSISDENVAKYFDGEVLAKSKGDCTIIATTPNGTKTECKIKVSAKIVNTGKCGDNITWTYYEDYSLIFTGTGDMQEYYDDIWYQPSNVLIPWHSYSPFVKEIIIEEGITSIAAFAFIDCKACNKITIPDSITKIGYCAFEHWQNYEGFVLSKNITELGAMAFHSCDFDVYYAGTEEDFDAIKKTPPKEGSGAESYYDEGTDTWITKPYDWSSEFKGSLLYYSDVQQSGCWHYVDGIPTAW